MYYSKHPLLADNTWIHIFFWRSTKTIDSVIILGSHKDFICDDVLGLDPVQLLQQSFKKRIGADQSYGTR